MDNNFAVFILSHGRAGNVKTYQTLINQGYTGKIYIIIDDEDDMRNSYIDMYVRYGETGHLIFTTMDFMLNQGQTQKNKGGLTEMYLDSGTYVKSFYSVMYSPSCVKVAAMGDKHMRMHHRVNWDCCTPKILNQRWKKSKGG